MTFLPVTMNDMKERGWEQLDFLYITGDAYVDHPSFGHAIISRVLEDKGYKVGIIPQPDWKNPESISIMGRPRLGVLVSSGVLDSMVNNYTASLSHRKEDRYSPDTDLYRKPDRALIVYCNLIKQVFKDIPIVIGGVEAGLRRFAHYDYWSDSVRRSILFDTRADILIYGMGETPVAEIADALNEGKGLDHIRSTAIIRKEYPEEAIVIASYEKVKENKRDFATAFKVEYEEQDPYRGHILVQAHGDRFLISNPPALPLKEEEMDYIYSLPYERNYHPMYEPYGGIKAIEEVKFSVTSHRGCFGGCHFCSIVFHQGRIIQKRSAKSIIDEVREMTHDKQFKGYINDVGGPTANFRNAYCKINKNKGMCRDKQCMYPDVCQNLAISHHEYLTLLRELRKINGIKKVFVKSGIRYDYLLRDNDEFLNELCEHHISGQLKVAPEHISPKVLDMMGKQDISKYIRFKEKYEAINKRLNKKQYLVPYFITGHPGETISDCIDMTEFLMNQGFVPDQIQDFYPTPGTISTCMYYTGYNPVTMEKVYVPKGDKERRVRRALMQFNKPSNRKLAISVLAENKRFDLVNRIKNH
ncbi:MAG: YgiQ family radical SAM protein [Clostridia bacterium]|nr:YgiQ family radical SAM protein [Clostridia bacterium]